MSRTNSRLRRAGNDRVRRRRGNPYELSVEDNVPVLYRHTRLLLATCLTFGAVALSAQSESRPTIRIVGGATASSLETSSTSTDALYGVALGAQYVMPVSGPWYLVPEVLLFDKGGRQTSGSSSVDVDLRSLDVSLLARWSTGSLADRRRVFAFAGPTYGRVLSCEAGSGAGSVFVTGDCVDNVNRNDVAFSFGGGLDFPSSSIDWGISLRYQHGITDIQKGAGEVRSRAVLLLLSYRL